MPKYKTDPGFKYDENGMPNLIEPWDKETLPDISELEITDSGRRPRGQLEKVVDYVVKEYRLMPTPHTFDCTAEYIAKRVEQLDGHKCSSGAVWRILDTWERIGYAHSMHKPRAFFIFTEDGMKKGLAELHRIYQRDRIKRREIQQRKRFKVDKKK